MLLLVPCPSLLAAALPLVEVILRVGAFLEVPGKGSDIRRLEQADDWDVDFERPPELMDDLDTEQRVATEIEKTVVDADLADPQDLLPDLCDGLLDRITRGDVSAMDLGARVEGWHRAVIHWLWLAQRHLLEPLIDAEPQIAGRDNDLRDGLHLQYPVERRARLRRCDRQRGHGCAERLGRGALLLVEPAIPVDTHPGHVHSLVMAVDKSIHKLVGRGIRGKSKPTQDRAQRRYRQAEIERPIVQRLLQNDQSVGFVSEVVSILGRSQFLDGAKPLFFD